MFSPHLPYSPSHNIHKFQFSLPLRFPVRPKIQKNSLIFSHKITFPSLHHMPLNPFTNKIGTNMQCQAFENQGFFKLGLILWGWPIAFIPHQSASQKKNVYIFIFFSHVPSFSWLEILKGFILHTLGAKQYRHIPTEQNNFHLHMGGFIESLILCCLLLLLLPSIFLSIKAFSNQSALRIRWQNYWSFSFSISLHQRMPWLDSIADSVDMNLR